MRKKNVAGPNQSGHCGRLTDWAGKRNVWVSNEHTRYEEDDHLRKRVPEKQTLERSQPGEERDV